MIITVSSNFSLNSYMYILSCVAEGALASKEGQNRNLRWQRVLLGVCNFVVGNNKSKKEKEGNIYLDLETYCKFNKVWAVVSVLSKWGCLSFCI